jgi:hypothetical protein
MMHPFHQLPPNTKFTETLVSHQIPDWAQGTLALQMDDGSGPLGYECYKLVRVAGHVYRRGYGLYWNDKVGEPVRL